MFDKTIAYWMNVTEVVLIYPYFHFSFQSTGFSAALKTKVYYHVQTNLQFLVNQVGFVERASVQNVDGFYLIACKRL